MNKEELKREYEEVIQQCNNLIMHLRDGNPEKLAKVVKMKEEAKDELQKLYK